MTRSKPPDDRQSSIFVAARLNGKNNPAVLGVDVQPNTGRYAGVPRALTIVAIVGRQGWPKVACGLIRRVNREAKALLPARVLGCDCDAYKARKTPMQFGYSDLEWNAVSRNWTLRYWPNGWLTPVWRTLRKYLQSQRREAPPGLRLCFHRAAKGSAFNPTTQAALGNRAGRCAWISCGAFRRVTSAGSSGVRSRNRALSASEVCIERSADNWTPASYPALVVSLGQDRRRQPCHSICGLSSSPWPTLTRLSKTSNRPASCFCSCGTSQGILRIPPLRWNSVSTPDRSVVG